MKARVAINDYHNGQICYPTVEVDRNGNHVRIKLCWIDRSEPRSSVKHEYGHATFEGSIGDGEKWLMEQGVRLDAQGIH